MAQKSILARLFGGAEKKATKPSKGVKYASVKPVSRIRTLMDGYGFDAYKAYQAINVLTKGGEVPFKEINKPAQEWARYETKRYDAYMETGVMPEVPPVKLSREEFYEQFYTPEQKEAIKDILSGVITCETLEKYMGISIPEEVKQQLPGNIVHKLDTRAFDMVPHSVFFAMAPGFKKGNIMARKKPVLVIGYPRFKEWFDNTDIPFIPCFNVRSYVVDICEMWRSIQDIQVVSISGSVGKTSTTRMIANVTRDARNTYMVDGNQNTLVKIATFMLNLPPKTEVFVQESSGSYVGQLENIARAIKPNIHVVTNVGHGHIGNYGGDRHNLMREKLAMDRELVEGGIGVINWDDELLKEAYYHNDVVKISIKNPDVDYFADNIVETAGKLFFDCVEKDGTRTAVQLNVCGLHNVYNALSAFAVGVHMGIDRESIVKSLKKFKSSGVRQNLVWYSGQHLYLDCYSITEDSVKSSMIAMGSIEVPEGGRKIAVIADIPDLGDQSEEIHRRIGQIVADAATTDDVFFYGEVMGYAYEEATKRGITCHHTADRLELESWLKNTSKDDLIMFKASHKMKLQQVIDDLFGTDYFITDEINANAAIINRDGMTFTLVDEDYGGGLTFAPKSRDDVVVPQEVDGIPIRIIGSRSFLSAAVKTVTLPEGIRCIAPYAFSNCTVEDISLPSTVQFVGEKAFIGCRNLSRLEFKAGLETICDNAFEGCTGLKEIVIPETVLSIDEDAFSNNRDVVIVCRQGSYTDKWAADNGMQVKYQ